MTEEKKTDDEEVLPFEKDSHEVIKLDGELTIERAHEIYKHFSGYIELGNPLLIDLSKIERIDLAFLQLIYSLNKEAAIRNEVIHIRGPLKESVRNVLTTSGFFSLHPEKVTGFEQDFYELGLG